MARGTRRFEIPGQTIFKRTGKPFGVWTQRDEMDPGMLCVFWTRAEAERVSAAIAKRFDPIVNFIIEAP